ncbi:MAG TPA: glycolate oxidase subunit GlcE [Burkholderiales bacterium]|nr:glycolate oxidase subunit GlcE [Burkholderiales bacterium]
MDNFVDNLSRLIREAAKQKRPLCIRGGGTKDFYGGPVHGYKLNTGDFRGIVTYEPTELVITARGGTPLTEIEAALREKGQMLAFEPPHFGEDATLGGCVAAGLSGPRRPYAGAVRDFVLGVGVLDGKGDDLKFGGQVMKNVAGYDVSRLMAGSLGTLGLLLEVSLKVLPLPISETTLHLECTEADAIERMNRWAAQPLPITATAYRDGKLGVRLSGARVAVDAAAKKLGGAVVAPEQAQRFWTGIREQTDTFFSGEGPLWRLSIKSTTPPLALPGAQLIEWGGALRWLKSSGDVKTIRDAAARAGGHATLFRGGDKSAGVFQPLPPVLMKLHRNLKQAFDPSGIFSPGRMYPDF